MKKEKSKNKKNIKISDVIILIVLISLVIMMAIFTTTRETGSEEIILMEIYKSAGPDTSTASPNHYYVYANTNVVGIRLSNFNNSPGQSSNNLTKKQVNQDLIDTFKNNLEEYIRKNITINTAFYTNERYAIEYNGKVITVPNPSVATALGFESKDFDFYYTVDSFINTINN